VRVSSEAEARRYAQAAGIKFPKPVPAMRATAYCRKHGERPGVAAGACGAENGNGSTCWIEVGPKRLKRTALAPRRRPIVQHSAKARKRIAEWAPLRDAVLARDGGRCLFCDGMHATTAHHVRTRATGGLDVETNLASIFQGRGFHGCHAAAHNDLRSSSLILRRKLAAIYRVIARQDERTGFWRAHDARNPYRKSFVTSEAIDESMALERGLACVQVEIDAGKRPSLLTPNPAGE
jgi:hypothetical protein